MRVRWIFFIIAGAILVLGVIAYAALLPGLSVARREPPSLEVTVATWLLHASVPDDAKRAVNPLGTRPDPAAVRAGPDLFTAKCETCHAFDGGGRTEIGAGSFPRPPALRALAPSLSAEAG